MNNNLNNRLKVLAKSKCTSKYAEPRKTRLPIISLIKKFLRKAKIKSCYFLQEKQKKCYNLTFRKKAKKSKKKDEKGLSKVKK